MKLTYDHIRGTDPEYATLLDEVVALTGMRVYPFGSRYTMGIDYARGDTDILLEVVDLDALSVIRNAGFTAQIAAGYAGSHIASYRRGDVNLVVMTDKWEFYARCACAELCRAQKTADKEDRRFIHRLIADVARVVCFPTPTPNFQ